MVEREVKQELSAPASALGVLEDVSLVSGKETSLETDPRKIRNQLPPHEQVLVLKDNKGSDVELDLGYKLPTGCSSKSPFPHLDCLTRPQLRKFCVFKNIDIGEYKGVNYLFYKSVTLNKYGYYQDDKFKNRIIYNKVIISPDFTPSNGIREKEVTFYLNDVLQVKVLLSTKYSTKFDNWTEDNLKLTSKPSKMD